MNMKAVFFACLLACVAVWTASAADLQWQGPPNRSYRVAPLPIAPDSLSATVLASDGCWRTCAASCNFHVRKCIKFEGVTDCMPLNESCDRTCVRECRAYGGPLLNLTE